MPFIIKEIHIKTGKNNCMPARIAKFPQIDNTNCSQECRANFVPHWWEHRLVLPVGDNLAASLNAKHSPTI